MDESEIEVNVHKVEDNSSKKRKKRNYKEDANSEVCEPMNKKAKNLSENDDHPNPSEMMASHDKVNKVKKLKRKKKKDEIVSSLDESGLLSKFDCNVVKGRIPVIRSYEEMLHYFPDVPEDEVTDHIPARYDRAITISRKLKDKDFTLEEIHKDMQSRVEILIDHHKKLADGILPVSDSVSKPTNFIGPYLPNYADVNFLKHLKININWALPKAHQLSLDVLYAGKTNFWYNNYIGEKDVKIIRDAFSKKEDERILSNWLKFKKKYNFYDLRPLLSFKTGRLEKEYDQLSIVQCHYLDEEQRTNFLVFMGQCLPDRHLFGIHKRLCIMTNRIDNDIIDYSTKTVTAREIAKVKYFVKKYGANFSVLELLLGEKIAGNYFSIFKWFIRTNHLPIRTGRWTKKEEVRLIRAIYLTLNENDFTDDDEKFVKPNWLHVFNKVRTRVERDCCKQWSVKLKSFSRKKAKLESLGDIDSTRWSMNHEIKLIDVIFHSPYESYESINFDEITKNEFAEFKSGFIQGVFVNLVNIRVPYNIRKFFNRTLDHLYHVVRQVLMRKKEKLKINKKFLKPLRKLNLSKQLKLGIECYYQDAFPEDDDDDSQFIDALSKRLESKKETKNLITRKKVLKALRNKSTSV